MIKTIIVTGTPGTGKTTVAIRLAKLLGHNYVDVNNIIKKEKLNSGYDRKKKCKVVDEKKLSKILVKMIKKSEDGLVIDSHMSHYLPTDVVDVCVVTKCNLKLLKRRLKRRKYGEEKIRDNLDCEIFDVCLNEAKETGHNIVVTETDKKIDYEKLVRKIKRKKIKK